MLLFYSLYCNTVIYCHVTNNVTFLKVTTAIEEVIQEVMQVNKIIGSMGCGKSRFRVTVICRGRRFTYFYFLKRNILSKAFIPNCVCT